MYAVLRSLLAVFLVLVVGVLLGVAWHRLLPPQERWQPRITGTQAGWVIRDPGTSCAGLVVTGDAIAWLSDDYASLLVMTLRDGRVRRLDTAARGEALSEPAAYGDTVYWAKQRGRDADPEMHGDLGDCRLYACSLGTGRVRLLAHEKRAEYYALSANQGGVVWLSNTSDGAAVLTYRLHWASADARGARILARGATESIFDEPQLGAGAVAWTDELSGGHSGFEVIELPSGAKHSYLQRGGDFAVDSRELVWAREVRGHARLFRRRFASGGLSRLGGALPSCDALRLQLGDRLLVSQLLPDGGLSVLALPREGGRARVVLRRPPGSAIEPALVCGATAVWMRDQSTIVTARLSP